MKLTNDRRPAQVVEAAIGHFTDGDDEAFLACFAADATVWTDPQLASSVVISGRTQLAAWCQEARRRWRDVAFAHGELSDQGAGAYVELDVVVGNGSTGGAWRLPIAVFVKDGLVVEVAPQADRESAIRALTAG